MLPAPSGYRISIDRDGAANVRPWSWRNEVILIQPTDTLNRNLLTLSVAITLAMGYALINGFDLATVLLICATPLALCLGWLNPITLAMGFLAVSCFRLHDAFEFLRPYRLPQLFGICVIVSVAMQVGTGRVEAFMRREIALVLIVFVHITLGLVFATDRDAAFEAWSGNFIRMIGATIFICWAAKWPRDCQFITSVIVICGAAVSCVAIYNWFYGINIVEGTRIGVGPVDSPIRDPNDLAFTLMFSVAFAVSLVMAKNLPSHVRVSAASVLLLLIWAILVTKSRGALIGVSAVFGLFVLRQYKINLKTLIVMGSVVALLLVLSGVGGREYSPGENGGLDESSAGRIYAWRAGIGMALSRPVFGVGFGLFVDNYWQHTPVWLGRNFTAHSMWFLVLGEAGFIGLGLYMAMIVYTFRSAYSTMLHYERDGRDPALIAMSRALFAGFAGTCAAGTFLSNSWTWPVFFQIAVIASLAQHAERSRARGEEPAAVPALPAGVRA